MGFVLFQCSISDLLRHKGTAYVYIHARKSRGEEGMNAEEFEVRDASTIPRLSKNATQNSPEHSISSEKNRSSFRKRGPSPFSRPLPGSPHSLAQPRLLGTPLRSQIARRSYGTRSRHWQSWRDSTQNYATQPLVTDHIPGTKPYPGYDRRLMPRPDTEVIIILQFRWKVIA